MLSGLFYCWVLSQGQCLTVAFIIGLLYLFTLDVIWTVISNSCPAGIFLFRLNNSIVWSLLQVNNKDTRTNNTQKMKFLIRDFSSKCDQIRRICLHLLEKSLMKNFIVLCVDVSIFTDKYLNMFHTLF